MKIKTVKELKTILNSLDDNLPIGTYHKNYWFPEFDKTGAEIEIIKKDNIPIGVATNIDYLHNY